MSEHVLWGYLAKAHHSHLQREVAMARGLQSAGGVQRLSLALRRLLLPILSLR